MNMDIYQIRKENELLKKQVSDKQLENKMIDAELVFIKHLQDMKRNNFILSIVGSFIVFTCTYFCINQSFSINDVNDILMLLGTTSSSIVIGAKLGNATSNVVLKDLHMNNNSVNEQELELIQKKESNKKVIEKSYNKLIANNKVIDNNNIIMGNNIEIPITRVETKVRKRVLKKIL